MGVERNEVQHKLTVSTTMMMVGERMRVQVYVC